MTRGRIFALVGGGALVIALGAGFGVWRSNTSGPSTTAAKAVMQQQLENAIKQSIQIVPSTAVPLEVNTALSSVATTRLLATEKTALRNIYPATSSYVSQGMWGYNNALQAITYARNTAMTFANFAFTSVAYINSNTTANVSFTALTSTTRQVHLNPTASWQTLQIPGTYFGSATLQYTNGQWLIQSIRLTEPNAG